MGSPRNNACFYMQVVIEMSSTDIEPYLDLLMLMTNENEEEDSLFLTQ